MKLRSYFPFAFISPLMFLLYFSCDENSDQAESLVLDTTSYQVSNLELSFPKLTGTIEDVTVTFNAPGVTEGIVEYLIFVVKTTAGFSVDQIGQMPTSQYHAIVSSESVIQTDLPTSLTDTDGDDITADDSYSIYVATVFEVDETRAMALATPSSPFMLLAPKSLQIDSIVVAAVGNTLTSEDVTIRFANPTNTSSVTGYQLFVTQDTETLPDLEALFSLNAQFLEVAPGDSENIIQLGPDFRDIQGQTLRSGTHYRILIVTLFMNDTAEGQILSEPSHTFELIRSSNLQAQSVDLCDVRDAMNASDFDVAFFAPARRDLITSFSIILVKEVNVEQFGLDQALELSDTQKLEVENDGVSFVIQLSNDFRDSDGEAIVEGIPYRAVVLSHYAINANGEILSEFSVSAELKPFDPIRSTTLATFDRNVQLDGMTLDTNGNVYISDYGGRSGEQIFKVTPAGEVSVFATIPAGAPGGLTSDDQDNIFIMSTANSIYKADPDGNVTVYLESEIGFAGLAIDHDGNIYSGGFNHPYLLQISPEQELDTIAQDPSLEGTVGIVYNTNEHAIFTANFNNGSIQKTKEGVVSELARLPGGIGYLTEINDVLYATLYSSHKIYSVTLDGVFAHIAGTGRNDQKDGPLLDARYSQPNGIVGSATEKILYVNDAKDRLIRLQLE